ncbi:MAG: hypothetical protein K9G58_15135 [Bacteroidales bacterium]|nr:hypothetical protein [Bacteroidales bacterium]MCF8388885.1 hypothetical protein [Bacteroidales bacterium]MCF8399506.1 hypothetical protein [Bacteroidales bacterium]
MSRYGIAIFMIVLFLSACSPKINVVQQKQQGKDFFNAGDYQASLTHWNKLIAYYDSRGEEIPGEIYLGAGKAYYEIGNMDEAISMLDQARYSEFNDPEIFEYLAKAYKQIDNLSKEIISLESYVNQFPEAQKIDNMRICLFKTYVESENWQLGYDLWPMLPDSLKENDKFLTGYFQINKGLDNHQEAMELARKIIKKDDDRADVLEYLAKYYYNTANDLYKREMQAYEKNKTHAQYARLLKALEDVNANFKVALQYFKKLYNQNPRESYAQYLANIYARFDDEKRAAYYREKAGQ